MKKKIAILLILSLTAFTIACASANYNQVMQKPEKMFYQGKFKEASRQLIPYVNKIGDRDRLLFLMEAGLMLQAAQDYELWTLLLEYTRGANLEDLLAVYRISNDSITAKHRSIQFKNQDSVILRTIQQQLPEFAISQEQVTQLRETFIGGIRLRHERKEQCTVFASLYLDLLAAFAKKSFPVKS